MKHNNNNAVEMMALLRTCVTHAEFRRKLFLTEIYTSYNIYLPFSQRTPAVTRGV